MHKIDIDSFDTLQSIIEDYDITNFTSITQFLIELLNHTFRQDIPDIRISIHRHILPPSYFKGSSDWKEAVQEQIQYPYLTFHKKYRGNILYIRASGNPSNQSAIFKKQLIQKIESDQKAIFLKKNIPKSYREQPYVILSRIRKERNLNIKIRYNSPTHITYVSIQPKIKLPASRRN